MQITHSPDITAQITVMVLPSQTVKIRKHLGHF